MNDFPRPQGVFPAVAPVTTDWRAPPGDRRRSAVPWRSSLPWCSAAGGRDSPRPRPSVPGWRVMVPGTAFGFVCIGLGLALVGAGHDAAARWWLPVLAGLAAADPDRDPRRVRHRRAMGRRALARRRLPARRRRRRSAVAGHRACRSCSWPSAWRRCRRAGQVWEGVLRLGAGTTLGHELVGRPRPLVRCLAPGRRAGIPRHGGADRGPAGGQQRRCAGRFGARAGPAARRPPRPGDRAGPASWSRSRCRCCSGSCAPLLARHLDRGLAVAAVVDHLRDDPGRRSAGACWPASKPSRRIASGCSPTSNIGSTSAPKRSATVNRQLHDSKVRLMEADRRKDEFLATLAHELRNPLAPIRTGLEILKSDGVSPLVAAQAHQVIGRQMRHLVRLIDDLLDVSRITANKLDLRLERVEVGEILHQGVETARADIEQRPARPHAAPAAARHRRARRRRRGSRRSSPTCCRTPRSTRRAAATSC